MTDRQSWQRCDHCAHELDELDPSARCPRCGGLLSIVHAPIAERGAALRAMLDADRSPSGVWRFGRLVLPTAIADAVTHPEGNTPLLERPALSAWCDLPGLRLKHEGHNPTGSFKDRGMTVAITQAKRIGVRVVACASTGNTSASMAAYAAQAGLTALAVVPDGQVATGKIAQTLAYGARTLLVRGDFDACLRLLQEASTSLGVYLVNSVNPFRLEGQKTIVLDLLQQLDWVAPDWIVLPAGNLGNTAAFGKAIDEAFALGLIDRKPRLAAIQAAGASPFAQAFARGFDRLEPLHASTIASAIRIGAPASYDRGVSAIRATNGVVASVSDDEIMAAKAMIDATGVGCEPASAASVAGIRKLRSTGIIDRDAHAVAILTGHLLKDAGRGDEIRAGASAAPTLANAPISIAATLQALESAMLAARP